MAHTIPSEQDLETLLSVYARDAECASVFLGSDSTPHHLQGTSQLGSKTDLCRSLDSVYKSSLYKEMTGLASSDQTRRVLERTNCNCYLTLPAKNELNYMRNSKPNAPITLSSQLHPRRHVKSTVSPTLNSEVLLSEGTLSRRTLQLSPSYTSAPSTDSEGIGHSKMCKCSSSNSVENSTIKNYSGEDIINDIHFGDVDGTFCRTTYYILWVC